MAQVQPCERDDRGRTSETCSVKDTTTTAFRFNAHAPEFVPRSQAHLSDLSSYYYPCFQFFDGGTSGGPDWLFVGDPDPGFLMHSGSSATVAFPGNCSRNLLSHDLQQKIVKQVEHLFSDMSLLANDSLTKHMSKDPEGYSKYQQVVRYILCDQSFTVPFSFPNISSSKVPISAIASMEKIKSLTINNHLLAQALRSSSKLVVSSDSKRVKRKHPFTEKDREDLQYRTVVVENLPEDHSHQNLEKIFSAVGSVKNIRVCHPQESNLYRPRCNIFVSRKLHALIEYENTDTAELAAEKLNDERNWRKGLRVRLLLKRSPKSVLNSRRSEFDCFLDDDGSLDSIDDIHPSNPELAFDSNAEDNSTGLKKYWGARGRGKARGWTLSNSGRALLVPTLQPNSSIQGEPPTKLTVKRPRMPDGTRGFTMGRGKPTSSPTSPASPTSPE